MDSTKAPDMGVIALRALLREEWRRADWVWLGLAFVALASTKLSGLAVLGSGAVFAYPGPRIRAAIIGACITIRTVASVLVLRQVLILVVGGP